MNAQTSKFYKVVSIFVLAALILSFAGIPAPQTGRSFIVRGESAEQAAQLVEGFGGQVTSRLEIIQAVGATLTESAAVRLRFTPGVLSVTPNNAVESLSKDGSNSGGNGAAHPPATEYPNVVGADQVWQNGITGQGVTVAVLDSGVDMPKGKIDGRLVGYVDLVNGRSDPRDPNGHGTHVAGIIANSELGEDGEYNGVAPGVNLVVARVLDKYGYSTYERVIQGIQWVVEHQETYNIRVLNISLVAPVQSPYWADPLNMAVMVAWSQGIVVVAAAGNAGPDPVSVGVPANNPYVVTVGAFTDNYTPDDWSDDYIAPFSSTGPTMEAFVKPDLVAPGGHIVSVQRPSTELARTYPDARVGTFYYKLAGTSQAAAVTSGVAALVLSAHPELTPDEVKYRLMSTALPWADEDPANLPYSIWQQGMGRLNAPDAVLAEISGSANTGLDIVADLSDTTHYQGWSEYNAEANEFTLGSGSGETLGGLGYWSGASGTWEDGLGSWGGGFGSWTSGLGNWSGGLGNWSGGLGNWSGTVDGWPGGMGDWPGGLGNWSGGLGNWSGGLGNWSGGLGNWSGGLGNWSGGLGNWSGGFGNWSGGFGNWSGSIVFPGSTTNEP